MNSLLNQPKLVYLIVNDITLNFYQVIVLSTQLAHSCIISHFPSHHRTLLTFPLETEKETEQREQ